MDENFGKNPRLNCGNKIQNRLPRRTEETGTKGPHIWKLWVKRKGSSEGNFNPSSVLTDVGVVENIMI